MRVHVCALICFARRPESLAIVGATMTSSNSVSATKQRPVLAAGAHGRWYILATISLAFFFFAVMLWQRPPKSFTAKIDIHQTGQHGQLDDRDAIIAAIFKTHDEHAHHHDDHGHDHDHSANHETGEQPHLLVDVVTLDGEKQISIWCACRSADAALAEAEMLAEAYVARVALPVDVEAVKKGNAAEQRAAVDRANAKLAKAQQELAQFEKRHAAMSARETETEQTPDLHEVQAAVAEPNPQWIEANQRLIVLQRARDQLLQEKTFQHPSVRDLQWQIESVEAELAILPRTIVRESPVHHIAQPQPPLAELSPELEEQSVELQRAVSTAQAELVQAETALRQAAEKTVEKPTSDLVVSIDGPAKIVSTHGAGASLTGVIGGALTALLLGILVASRSLVIREPSTLVSLQRVASLGVPVAASLHTGDGPDLAPPQVVNPSWVAWLTFACELMIAAIALLLLLSALADWQFAAHLVRNPLSALTEVANRLW